MKQRAPKVSIPEITKSLSDLPKDSNIFIEKSMAISKKIYLMMLKNKWLQKDLAQSLGKSEPEISKLLSGSHNYTLRTISKLESVLNVDLINITFLNDIKYEIKAGVTNPYTVSEEIYDKSTSKPDWNLEGPAVVISFSVGIKQKEQVQKEKQQVPQYSKAS